MATLIAGALVVVALQQRELAQLRAESQRLQAQPAQVAAGETEPAQALPGPNADQKVEQLRKDHRELLRLRNEVHQLREEKAELASSQQAELERLRREKAETEQALKSLQQQRIWSVVTSGDRTRIDPATGLPEQPRVWFPVPPGTNSLPKANAWLGLVFTAQPDSGDPASGPSRIVVQSVAPNSPAAEARLESGDVILRADGEAVTNQVQFRNKVATSTPGQSLVLEVLRDNVPRQVTVIPKPPPL